MGGAHRLPSSLAGKHGNTWRKEGNNMFGLIPRRREERRLARLERDGFDSLLERMFGRMLPMFEPALEVEMGKFEVENKEKEVVVRVEVPGFEPAEVSVEFGGDMLIIRAEHKEEKKEEEKKAPERFWGKMERMVMLPPGIEPEKIEAICKNGLLEVVIPKKPETVLRKIPVKT
jgi:HSP20 family protein